MTETNTINRVAVDPEPLRSPPGAVGRASLFLDFDGTLAEIAERPDAVQVAPGLIDMLGSLRDQLGGRLAIVSGRAITEIAALMPIEGLAIGGSHGLELRMSDGRMIAPDHPAALDDIVAELRALAAQAPGALVEAKPFGAAFHYRGAIGIEAEARALIEQLAAVHGLTVQAGKRVLELRPGGHDKGDAIRAFMAEPLFAGATPWFLGDDITDEHGFAAVLGLGGAGVLIGEPRETAARYRLKDVTAVHRWLAGLLEADQ